MNRMTICKKTKTAKKFGNEYVDTFLVYYIYKTKEEAEAEAEALNREKPAKLWNGEEINWNEVEYFFAHEQEEMID